MECFERLEVSTFEISDVLESSLAHPDDMIGGIESKMGGCYLGVTVPPMKRTTNTKVRVLV